LENTGFEVTSKDSKMSGHKVVLRDKCSKCGGDIHFKQRENGMIQSMSRKENCQDNSPTENFFGRLKEKMFYGQEWRFEIIKELVITIDRRIKCYNSTRIIMILENSSKKGVQYTNVSKEVFLY